MEKIYMEDSKKKKKSVIDSTVVLSFVVAIFAIVSLVAFGINQISYAAPIVSPTNDSFKFYLGPQVKADSSTGVTDIVPLYFSDSTLKNPIFCVEHKAPVRSDEPTYTMEKDANGNPEKITNYGLLYILDQAYSENGMAISADASAGEVISNVEYARAWIVQSAIWLYLNDTSNNSMDKMEDSEINMIKNATSLYYDDDDSPMGTTFTSNVNLYTKYIEPLVTKAKSLRNNMFILSTDSRDFSAGDDFYQSPKITLVQQSGEITSYSIGLSGIDGATVVDSEGNSLDPSNVPGSKKEFYVRVPKKNLKKETQKLYVDVTANFNILTGNYYATTGTDDASGNSWQRVISVTGSTESINNGTDFEIAAADDTGMNKIQTIYFIGLIVLLCGVGIVYANAKPVEVKQ